MMTHDPFQNYQAFGAYPGLPYTAFQPFVNPAAYAGQPLSNPGIGGYGSYPQPVGQQAFGQPLQTLNPLAAGLQNPLLQNPLLQNPLLQNPLLQHQLAQGPWQNPLLAANLQNQQLNPMIPYHTWPQQQQQFTYPLAPQSLIGAGGNSLSFGQIQPQIHPQIHAMIHAALRQATGFGYPSVPGYY
jgi:hypothetical protein